MKSNSNAIEDRSSAHCSPWSDAPETLHEWRKSETLRPDLRAKRMANHAVQLERERNEARCIINEMRAALEAIEGRYIDGCDTYEDWKFMGDTARAFLSENR